MMSIVDLLKSKSAPFAGGRREQVSLVQLNVLHGVAQAELVYSRAPCHVSLHLHNWHIVDQFFRVRQVSIIWDLKLVPLPVFVIEFVFCGGKSARICSHEEGAVFEAEEGGPV